MTEDRIERRAHWFQVAAGLIIAATAWCVKLQMNLNEVRRDIELSQINVQHYRDVRQEKDLSTERRLTKNEESIEWLKRGSNGGGK